MSHVDFLLVVDLRHIIVEVRDVVPELLVDDGLVERPEERVAVDKLVSTYRWVEVALENVATGRAFGLIRDVRVNGNVELEGHTTHSTLRQHISARKLLVIPQKSRSSYFYLCGKYQ